MYPQDVPEVIFIELIANSLDAKANKIEINFDERKKVLVVKDDGVGMDESQFDQYHDFAAGFKTRGSCISFAGVGAKISFNVADRVITETKSKSFSGASDWYFQSKKKLVWEDTQPTHLKSHGTRVEIRFQPKSGIPLSTTEDIVILIQRYYLPLLDKQFLDLYDKIECYSDQLRFAVNGRLIQPENVVPFYELEKVKEFIPKKGSKRIGYGILGLSKNEYPLGTDVSGILLCTRGKVIKPELFNQFPGALGSRIFGVVEVPEFVKFLTTSKTDFIRRGKHRELERLFAPIRDEFKNWLSDIGLQQMEPEDTTEVVKLERELRKMLDSVPELSEFFGFRSQKNIPKPDDLGENFTSPADGIQSTFPAGEGSKGEGSGATDAGDEEGSSLVEDEESGTVKAKPISRTSKKGPKIAFDTVPNRLELAWVEGNTIIINSGHPCYIKSRSNPLSRRLHNFYAIASAVQRFLATGDVSMDLTFIDRMMSVWGQK